MGQGTCQDLIFLMGLYLGPVV